MSKKTANNQEAAKELLRHLGNPDPSPEHAALAAHLLFCTTIHRQLAFSEKLTESEVCCLYWAALGYNSRKTAHIMSTKVCTIESYRKEIKRKLRCNTIAQAVYEGICFGYMPLKINSQPE